MSQQQPVIVPESNPAAHSIDSTLCAHDVFGNDIYKTISGQNMCP